jgi:hypothetical protein
VLLFSDCPVFSEALYYCDLVQSFASPIYGHRLEAEFESHSLSPTIGYALWAEATEAIQKFGVMIKSPSGYPVQSPYVSVANRQAEIMMRIASEFGFTPASRSRISAQPRAEPTLFDRFEDLPDEAS